MKYKLGVKEIIVCISGALIFMLLTMLKNEFYPFGITSNVGDYFNASLGSLAVIAAMFGPVCGGIVGLSGAMMADVMQAGRIYTVDVASACIFGVFIGLFEEKFLVWQGEFRMRQFVDYTCVTILAGIMNWIMLCPLVAFFTMNCNLLFTLMRGCKVMAGSTFFAMVFGAIVMSVVSRYRHKKMATVDYMIRKHLQ